MIDAGILLIKLLLSVVEPVDTTGCCRNQLSRFQPRACTSVPSRCRASATSANTIAAILPSRPGTSSAPSGNQARECAAPAHDSRNRNRHMAIRASIQRLPPAASRRGLTTDRSRKTACRLHFPWSLIMHFPCSVVPAQRHFRGASRLVQAGPLNPLTVAHYNIGLSHAEIDVSQQIAPERTLRFRVPKLSASPCCCPPPPRAARLANRLLTEQLVGLPPFRRRR